VKSENIMQIGIIYFSPTCNTYIIANHIVKTLEEISEDSEIITKNITLRQDRKKFDFSKYDLIFFGFPVYGWRAPGIIRNWIKTLNGHNKYVSTFFTYGGINPGFVHSNTKNLLEKQDFRVISSAEFVASHSFNLVGWDILKNRPNNKDLELAQEYSKLTVLKFLEASNEILDFRTKSIPESTFAKIENNIIKFIEPPLIEGKKCSNCLKCELECPSGAIELKRGYVDSEKCIRCFRCVKICPKGKINGKDMSKYQKIILKLEKINMDVINNQKSKIFI
jgi:ferredoxin